MILGARSIGNDVVIRQNTTFGIRDASDLAAKPTIEDGVNIGAGAVIVGNITIGHHSKIAPNTVVIENIPPFSTVYVKPTIVTKNV
ncbi:Serine acetyltransferase [gamma proteobacterium IMCC1989]|nr:Serine acetyltransferase [gamma proteobacterium IMCC1989]